MPKLTIGRVAAAAGVNVETIRYYQRRGLLEEPNEHSTKRPWTQPIGFQHALFEVAIDVLKRTKNLGEPSSILEAIVGTDYSSIVGPINWSGKPVKNVSKTPLVLVWQLKQMSEPVVSRCWTASGWS